MTIEEAVKQSNGTARLETMPGVGLLQFLDGRVIVIPNPTSKKYYDRIVKLIIEGSNDRDTSRQHH